MANPQEIINEVLKFSGFKRKNDFAQFLGLKKTTVSNWFHGSPFDVRMIAEKMPNISAEYLLRGEGPIRRPRQGEQYTITNAGDTAIRGNISTLDPSVLKSFDKDKDRLVDEIKFLRSIIEEKNKDLAQRDAKIDEKDKKIIELYEKITELSSNMGK